MDSKTKEALKQLQAEVRQLQASLGQTRDPSAADPAEEDKPGKKEHLSATIQSAFVQYTVTATALGADAQDPAKAHHSDFTELQLRKVSDEAAAALGYALSSPQKIALLRALWSADAKTNADAKTSAEAETAATLGDAAHLTTGSLYHHLRELMHANLVFQSGRNRYVLSPRGERVLPLILALASEE